MFNTGLTASIERSNKRPTDGPEFWKQTLTRMNIARRLARQATA